MWNNLWRISEKAREASSMHLAWDHLASRHLALWQSVHDPNSERGLQDLEERRAGLKQHQTYLDHSKRWHDRPLGTSIKDVEECLYPCRTANSAEKPT